MSLDAAVLDGIEGLHFHTLCELGSDALERTVAAFEARFSAISIAGSQVGQHGRRATTSPARATTSIGSCG